MWRSIPHLLVVVQNQCHTNAFPTYHSMRNTLVKQLNLPIRVAKEKDISEPIELTTKSCQVRARKSHITEATGLAKSPVAHSKATGGHAPICWHLHLIPVVEKLQSRAFWQLLSEMSSRNLVIIHTFSQYISKTLCTCTFPPYFSQTPCFPSFLHLPVLLAYLPAYLPEPLPHL